MPERHVVKYFASGWFSIVMGTGGVANVLFRWQDTFAPGRVLGIGLAAVAALCLFLFIVPWTLRWFRYFPYVRRDLEHPTAMNYFVAMPVAVAIVGTNVYTIWSQYVSGSVVYNLCFFSWVVILVGVAAATFHTTFSVMRAETAPSPETINFSWIMPPIANMAVLLIGNPVLRLTIADHPQWAVGVMVVNLAYLGIGFFLFIFMGAIVFGRLAQHALPPVELTPTFALLLGAAGLAAGTIIDMSRNARDMGFLTSTDFSNLFVVTIWGFGIWIVGIIIIICLFHMRRGGIPFSLGWWGFIFPLATYTSASQKMMADFPTLVVSGYTAFLTLLLAALWIYTFINTIRGVCDGRLFSGVPIADITP